MTDVLFSLWSSGFLTPILAFIAGCGAMVAAYWKGRKDNDEDRDKRDAIDNARVNERIIDALEEDLDARSGGVSWADRLRDEKR